MWPKCCVACLYLRMYLDVLVRVIIYLHSFIYCTYREEKVGMNADMAMHAVLDSRYTSLIKVVLISFRWLIWYITMSGLLTHVSRVSVTQILNTGLVPWRIRLPPKVGLRYPKCPVLQPIPQKSSHLAIRMILVWENMTWAKQVWHTISRHFSVCSKIFKCGPSTVEKGRYPLVI